MGCGPLGVDSDPYMGSLRSDAVWGQTQLRNLSTKDPELVAEMLKAYDAQALWEEYGEDKTEYLAQAFKNHIAVHVAKECKELWQQE